jgi:hypothetical protein
MRVCRLTAAAIATRRAEVVEAVTANRSRVGAKSSFKNLSWRIAYFFLSAGEPDEVNAHTPLEPRDRPAARRSEPSNRAGQEHAQSAALPLPIRPIPRLRRNNCSPDFLENLSAKAAKTGTWPGLRHVATARWSDDHRSRKPPGRPRRRDLALADAAAGTQPRRARGNVG